MVDVPAAIADDTVVAVVAVAVVVVGIVVVVVVVVRMTFGRAVDP